MSVAREPLDVTSVADRVYAALRADIATGRLPNGMRLPQAELAERLGVSRTPLREALRRLAAEGLVDLAPHRGARVVDLTRRAVLDAYRARIVVEPGAARMAAERREPADLERMAAALRAQRRAGASPSAYHAANRDFHLGLVAACGSGALLAFVERLWTAGLGSALYDRRANDREALEADLRAHEAILAAIRAGRADDAERLARGHLQRASALIDG